MTTTTWELHYWVPRYPADQQFMVGYLELLKNTYSALAIDFDQDDEAIHVMIGDVRTLRDVITGLHAFGPHSVSVTLDEVCPLERGGLVGARSKAVLNEVGNGDSESSLEVGS